MRIDTSTKQKLATLQDVEVVKRDGTITPFYAYKLGLIMKRLNIDWATQAQIYDQLVSALAGKKRITTVEIAQAMIDGFRAAGHNEYAMAFINYRKKDDQAFAEATNPMYKLDQLSDRNSRVVHENANKDSRVFNTQRDLEAGMVSRALGLRMLPRIVAKAHLRGDIHWHDLDYSPVTPETNCCLIDFDEMFKNGFKIGNAWVSSPRSIQTATAQMSQIIANVASLQYGGCSANRIDQLLEPYAKINYEKHMKDAEEWIAPDKREAYAKAKTKKDIYDAMQALEYEINTLYSSQGQTPFTTINFGLGTSWIAREIQKSILKIRIKGLGKEHRTAIFPKLIFTLKRGLNLNPSDPNYDIKQLALECSTKRMVPTIGQSD